VVTDQGVNVQPPFAAASTGAMAHASLGFTGFGIPTQTTTAPATFGVAQVQRESPFASFSNHATTFAPTAAATPRSPHDPFALFLGNGPNFATASTAATPPPYNPFAAFSDGAATFALASAAAAQPAHNPFATFSSVADPVGVAPTPPTAAPPTARDRRAPLPSYIPCRTGHAMQISVFAAHGYEQGWTCDSPCCPELGVPQLPSTPRFFCSACRVDLCQRCGLRWLQGGQQDSSTNTAYQHQTPIAMPVAPPPTPSIVSALRPSAAVRATVPFHSSVNGDDDNFGDDFGGSFREYSTTDKLCCPREGAIATLTTTKTPTQLKLEGRPTRRRLATT
jgi:hypothetical protein